MLIPRRHLAGIADGSITVAFRRWRRPTVKAGGTLVTAVGVLGIDEVTMLDDDRDLTDEEVGDSGLGDRDELLAALADRPGALYRIRFHLAGEDPREALRCQADLDDDERAELAAKLERLDRASRHGTWTDRVLRLIADRPGVRAGDLAADIGRERTAFKSDVRKLKTLGLTESLEVGYRISPRGATWLEAPPDPS